MVKLSKMFTPKLNSGPSRPRVSPFPSAGKKQTGRRSSTYGSQPPTRNPSVQHSSSCRGLLQTPHILEETPLHRVEEYGGSLPVLVREAVILANKNQVLSVRIDANGWARLVCGRQLFVWRFNDIHYSKCHELTLPPSDVAHSADLVALLVHPSDPLTSACVAASPEGVIRYWSSVNHESSFVEVTLDLKGEEAGILLGLQTFQCVLATTSSTLTMLLPDPTKNQISTRILCCASGMLAGISRRMSSFIFGVATSHTPGGTSLRRLLSGDPVDDTTSTVYLLSGSLLQKIAVSESNEKVLYQCDVDQFLRPCLAETVWGLDVDNLPNLRTWLIDMQNTRDGVVVLAAGMNPDVSQQLYYVFGTLHTEGSDSPQSFLSFTVSKFTSVYQNDDKTSALNYRLLLPDPTSPSIYMYNDSTVICMSVNTSSQLLDKVEFITQGDRLLGAGHYGRQALYFSAVHGLVSVTGIAKCANSRSSDIPAHTESAVTNDSVLGHVTIEKVHELSVSEDRTARLKGAFLHACRGNMTQARTMIEDLFPSDIPLPSEPGSTLDTLVSLLSEEMVNDYPASDPRWAESVPQEGVTSSVSLILLHQLEDKLKAHEVYVSFLNNVNLWPRIHTMLVRNTALPTRMLLCEHAEKLTAAISLRALHTQNQHLVDRAIRKVLDMRGESIAETGLTTHDVFYRKVSGIDDILCALIAVEEEELASDLAPVDMVSIIASTNTIFTGMLQEAWQYRQSKSFIYQPNPRGESEPEFIPWTISPSIQHGSQQLGVRALLSKQHTLTAEYALNAARDAVERGELLQHLVELSDIILEGYKSQLAWIRQAVSETEHYNEVLHEYHQMRTQLIKPFMKIDQYERAASLAEKYCDFAVLVEICETTNNEERLQRYMNQFQSRGFADFVFKWYVEAGKRGKLMTSVLSHHPHLGRFLHQGDNDFLSWVHDINSADYLKAHQTLMELGYKETDSLAKRKTLMSLSKLTALASENPPMDLHKRLEAINDDHDVMLHQEMLPKEVVQALGIQVENMAVFTAKELIELYIGDLNVNANEFDFKKALDLLRFIDKEDPQLDYASILVAIWCKAILRDKWDELSANDLLERSKETVFFKTVELAYTEGMDLREFLPTAEKLLSSSDIGDLRNNTNFQYLVKAGYEQIKRILA